MSIQENTTQGALSLRGVCIQFGEGETAVEALRDFDLAVRAGEFVSVLGPSGCGKSTLIGAIAGLSRLCGGEVHVDGKHVERPGPDRGVVFQQHTLFPWKTVRANVEFGLKLRGVGRREREEAARKILHRVGLDEFLDHFPAQLSGGMQQRVNLARALVNRPRVLLMDEPFASLDAQTRLLMQELLLELWGEYAMTIIFVTHDIDEALFLADRVVVLSRRPAEVRADIAVRLSRPRTAQALTSVAFTALKRRCLDLLRNESSSRARTGQALLPENPETITESFPHEASV